MATYFFHEETHGPDAAGRKTLVRYYFDDISSEVLTRSFRLFPDARTEFLGNERIPFADLHIEVKRRLLRCLARRDQTDLRLAS